MKGSVAKFLVASLCFSVLVWMIWHAGPLHLWQTLSALPFTIALCVLVWGVGYLLNAASFARIIGGVLSRSEASDEDCLPFLQVLRLTITGYAINYITPFGLLGGEPWRILQLKQAYGVERATQSVVLYSMMHMASHFCFWLISLLVALSALPDLGSLDSASDLGIGLRLDAMLVVATLAILALLLLFWRLYRRGIALRFMRRWVDWPLLNPSLLPSAHFLWALVLEFVSRLVNVVEYWLIMQALGYDSFGYAEALLVVAFSSLFANVLFFSPLQMGTREGGIFLALQYLLPGDMLPVAVTLSFATRIREFLWIAIGLSMMTGNGRMKN